MNLFSPVTLIRPQVTRARPRTFSTAQGQAKAKARHVQGLDIVGLRTRVFLVELYSLVDYFTIPSSFVAE